MSLKIFCEIENCGREMQPGEHCFSFDRGKISILVTSTLLGQELIDKPEAHHICRRCLLKALQYAREELTAALKLADEKGG